LDVDWFIDGSCYEGAEDVQTIEDEALLSGKG
jgi:hypothetical protein